MQRCVTLFSTEAEYMEMVDEIEETLYVTAILEFLIPRLRPVSIHIFEDNRGDRLHQKPLELVEMHAH